MTNKNRFMPAECAHTRVLVQLFLRILAVKNRRIFETREELTTKNLA